jgi:hypothetical protein
LLGLYAACAAAEDVSEYLLPEAAVQSAIARLPQRGHGALIVAATVETTLGLADGSWLVEDDSAIWRLRLRSAGATLLMARLADLDLPQGAELRFSDASGSVVHGPYGNRDRNDSGGLFLPLVPGDAALLEIRAPLAARDAVRLSISGVSHGIVPIDRSGSARAKSGSCNIDVACSQGDPWRDEIRSVVRLTVPIGDFVFFCSGQLMNNTLQDKSLYLLTADHCDIRSGVLNGNVDDVIAYFNYQSSSCGRLPPNGNLGCTAKGNELLGRNASSDYTLISLVGPLPDCAGNAYFAGFNADPQASAPDHGVSIHHPSGDEKRISTFVAPAQRRNKQIIDDLEVDSFVIRWDQGVTEGGSSGAGLWNKNRQIVGVLSGGSSDCANPTEEDYFGRLDVAWNQGLSTFLDKGGTLRKSFCGRSADEPCNPDAVITPVPPQPRSGGGGGGKSGGGGALDLTSLLMLLAAIGLRGRALRP